MFLSNGNIFREIFPFLLILIHNLKPMFLQYFLFAEFFDIRSNHLLTHLTHCICWLPREICPCFCTISKEKIHLCRTEVLRIHLNKNFSCFFVIPLLINSCSLPIYLYTNFFETPVHKVTNCACLSSGNNIILGFILLEHTPHSINIILRMSPISLRIEVSEIELLLKSKTDLGYRHSDLTSHECLTTNRRLMVKENSIACKHPITLLIVTSNPHSVELCCTIWTARMHRRLFSITLLWAIVVKSSEELRS